MSNEINKEKMITELTLGDMDQVWGGQRDEGVYVKHIYVIPEEDSGLRLDRYVGDHCQWNVRQLAQWNDLSTMKTGSWFWPGAKVVYYNVEWHHPEEVVYPLEYMP